jgi:hypothetical protein
VANETTVGFVQQALVPFSVVRLTVHPKVLRVIEAYDRHFLERY